MTINRLVYLIVAAFVTGNLILIFIKYTSDKNIQNLINDNEKLLNEFDVSRRLQTLKSDLVQIDSKIRGTVTTNDLSFIEGVELQMTKVRDDVGQLQKITDDRSSEEYIDQLDEWVQKKLQVDRQIIEAYSKKGKTAAEDIIAAQQGKKLTDSILLLTKKISNVRQSLLSHVTDAIDDSVKKVQRLDSFLIVFVLASAAVLFWYIVTTIRTQGRLIQQVSDSERKVKEAARIKENFLANMSHEIRTPMNAILGFTHLLLRKNLDSESSLYVQTIQHSGENLLTIINDILDLSKIEAGMMRIEVAPFSLRELIHSIETMFKAKAEEKGIHLFTKVEESLPDTLKGDAIRLTQILINLIGNAVKFTSKGSVSLTFNNKGIEDGTLYLGLEVRDTGIGIEKEKLNLIFGRFQQADEDVTRKYGGTGLGLSIVKELVELQHGQIRAKSERGEGTTFYLTIPYKICREPYISHRSSFMQQSTEPVPLQQDQNVRILIVEDNDVNQTLLRHIFRNWQINFEIAGNGIEALDKLKNGTYDLVLMDIQMPELDGYTTTQQIRNHLKLNIPIIAMTAHAMAGEREKCLSYGMNEYISKPLREEELRKLILQFVSLNTRLPLKSEKESVPLPPTYQYINLTYMKEVSSGNIEYEKEVTIQFIGSVPQQLKALDEAAQSSDSDRLKKIAHNLKTTVSVMGLNEVLERYLSEIEDGEAKENLLKENIENIKQICFNALPEATHFLASLS